VPLIFELTCGSCGFKKEMSTGYAVVDMEDGREEICGHPTERSQAKRLTGLDWSDLVGQGRIGYRYALTCRACGRTDNYRTRRPSRRGPFSGLVGGITHVPSEKEASTHTCNNCGSHQLIASSKVGSGLGHRPAPCPQCQQPLATAITAIS
jgi:hypothetical protein